MAIPKQTKLSSHETDQTEERAAGTGRRAYVRYPAVLNATIVMSQGRKIPCEMRNFCMGGMLLHYKQLSNDGRSTSIAMDEVITVHCEVPDAHGVSNVEFRASIARTTQDGVGVAFVNPDQENLQVMRAFALQFSVEAEKRRSQEADVVKSGYGKSGTLGRRYNDIISGCGRIVQETMDALLKELSAKMANHMFAISRDASSPEIQNDFFAASEAIKVGNAQFLDAIRSAFEARLRKIEVNPFSDEQSRHANDQEFSLEEMSLVGDDDLGAWLAVSEVAHKVEEKNKDSLACLEKRLSVVFDRNISHANNPYSPALFAESFQEGLGQLEFKESVNVACYGVLKEDLITRLSVLYGKLNSILVEYGILPNLKLRNLGGPVSSINSHEASTQSRSADSGSTARNEVGDSTSPTDGQGGSVTSEAAHKASDLIESPIQGSQEPIRAVASESPLNNPADDSKSTSEAGSLKVSSHHSGRSRADRSLDNQETPSDLYQVLQDLRDLQRTFSARRAYAPPDAQTNSRDALGPAVAPQPGEDLPDYYSTSELVAAVADLQTNPRAFEPNGGQVIPFKSRVLSALSGHSHAEDGKGLNPRDSNVLEVTGDFLHAVQSDPLVAGSVKPWLKKLELPVLKLALQDPTLFFDQSHVARQVVNSIAELEFYRSEGASAGQNSISAAVEKLLEKIAMEHSDGVEIFSEIQAKLNKLVKIQNLAYAENVKDVVKACQQNPPVPEVYKFAAIDGSDISDSEMHKWTMFAQRLREGDDVLFSLLDGKPQRLRVAWMDAQRTLYVFVNLRGIKEKVMAVSDVAKLIRLGMIEPQGNAADPAMDRAQYSIMQNLYKQVVFESTHDSLTGLINRREFSRRLDEAVMDAKRQDKKHALMLIDIDQFGAINGNCGYGGGDKLLRDLIEILKKDLEDKAEIARVGSDEFGILVRECSLDDVLEIAERQIEEVANYKLDWEGNLFSVGLSVGIVPISARSGTVDELLQAAETSCNIAKDAGGNRLQVFHAGHSRLGHQGEVKKWAAKVDKILEESGLEIRCQRIEPIDSDGLLRPHFEILLGVKDEQGNIVSPVEFIKGAELSHKMSEVDRYVITTVLTWMNENADVIENFAGFTINLSGESLNEEGFVDFILDQLQGCRVPLEKICFEVTETVGITSLSDATLGIDRIKDTGCRFALDDFGSGMSSYGYLKNLPVDVVKIDGAFVKDLVADSSDYAVVKSITEIAHFMKKKVVAEFVENDDTLELLREIGVDYVQGFMIDKPGSLDRLVNMQFSNGA